VLLKLPFAANLLKLHSRALETAMRMLVSRCTHVTLRTLVGYMGMPLDMWGGMQVRTITTYSGVRWVPLRGGEGCDGGKEAQSSF
jgi:hypothetical protein